MLKGDGFLGSGATLGADVTLLSYVILLVPLMVLGFRYARGEKFSNHRPFFLSPTVHALVGGSGQVLATYLVLRMWLESVLPGFLLVKNIKTLMRLTLGLWFLSATLGIATYIFWYLLP
jgi:uncharacterized membrane protein YozB (DUF420 family)